MDQNPMPLIESTSPMNGNGNHSSIPVTELEPLLIKMSHIHDGPRSINERQPIKEKIACGSNKFDISFYCKPEDENMDNSMLMIVISHRKTNSGVKRARKTKYNQENTKRRRLNTSESYSINNDNSNNESDDDYVVSDRIELDFLIKYGVGDGNSYHKEHKCVFNDDSDSISSTNWNADEDSTCGSDPSVCSFATETFAELAERISNADNENMDKANVGCFEFRFSMQITNIERFDNQNGNGYSALNNKKRKRHRRKEKYKR